MCPLRPTTDLRLGGPLPRQLANRPRTPPPAHFCFPLPGSCGISPSFPGLFPTRGWIIHVLLTRPPLYSPCGFLVRLACVKRAASVDSEPGSNSHFICLSLTRGTGMGSAYRFPCLGTQDLTKTLHPTRLSNICANRMHFRTCVLLASELVGLLHLWENRDYFSPRGLQKGGNIQANSSPPSTSISGWGRFCNRFVSLPCQRRQHQVNTGDTQPQVVVVFCPWLFFAFVIGFHCR